MDEILTADERQQAIQRAVDGWGDMDCRYGDREQIIAEEVERAVVSRLAAVGGEVPEPRWRTDARIDGYGEPAYTVDQYEYGVARGVAAGMAAERARCVAIAAPERTPFNDDEWRVRCEIRDAIEELT